MTREIIHDERLYERLDLLWQEAEPMAPAAIAGTQSLPWENLRNVPIRSFVIAPHLCHQGRVSSINRRAAFHRNRDLLFILQVLWRLHCERRFLCHLLTGGNYANDPSDKIECRRGKSPSIVRY